MSCGVHQKYRLDPALLQLRGRPEAVAPISPLALELSYAAGTALKKEIRVPHLHIQVITPI